MLQKLWKFGGTPEGVAAFCRDKPVRDLSIGPFITGHASLALRNALSYPSAAIIRLVLWGLKWDDEILIAIGQLCGKLESLEISTSNSKVF